LFLNDDVRQEIRDLFRPILVQSHYFTDEICESIARKSLMMSD